MVIKFLTSGEKGRKYVEKLREHVGKNQVIAIENEITNFEVMSGIAFSSALWLPEVERVTPNDQRDYFRCTNSVFQQNKDVPTMRLSDVCSKVLITGVEIPGPQKNICARMYVTDWKSQQFRYRAEVRPTGDATFYRVCRPRSTDCGECVEFDKHHHGWADCWRHWVSDYLSTDHSPQRSVLAGSCAVAEIDVNKREPAESGRCSPRRTVAQHFG
ncbi:unnamed protein product [Nippostrongylus brasiliensis]|uniref:Sema domain-containing protein n=1 Tax=Nippostrongylus brasiliensis TaxID=27835 RepID=A0A0N4XSR1_NIPBR|nr:unnamed protein product [Nippostrongylus brasiliensis]